MSTGGSLARNSAGMVLAQVCTRAASLIFSLYAARVLGVEGFGQYGFAVALSAYFTVVAECGLFQYQISAFPLVKNTPPASILLGQSLSLRALLGFLSGVLLAGIGLLAVESEATRVLLFFLAATLLLNTVMGGFSAVLYGYEKFGLYSLFSSATQILATALSFGALLLGTGLAGIGAAQLACASLATVAVAILVSKRVCRPARTRWGELVGLFAKAAPLGVTTILVVFYYRANFAILSFLHGDEAVGYYNAAFALVSGLTVVTTTFGATLLPRMAKLHSFDRAGLCALYRRAFRYLLFAGVAVTFGGAVTAEPVIELLYSPAYLPSATALFILVWLGVPVFTNPLQASLLVARSAKRQLVIMTAAAAVCNLGASLALIPRFGFAGAASALVVSEILIWVYCLGLNLEFLPLRSLLPHLARALLAAAAMCLTIWPLRGTNVLWSILFGAATYTAALFLLRGLTPEDFRGISRLTGRATRSPARE